MNYGVELRDENDKIICDSFDYLAKAIDIWEGNLVSDDGVTFVIDLTPLDLPHNISILGYAYVSRLVQGTNDDYYREDWFDRGVESWVTGSAPNYHIHFKRYDLYDLTGAPRDLFSSDSQVAYKAIIV